MKTRTVKDNQAGQEIVLDRVSKIYGSGDAQVAAIDNISLAIPGKQFVCCLGKSGSGKSTLLHLLGGLIRPTAGTVKVGDVSVDRLSLDEAAIWRRHNVGVVHQFFNLIPSLTIVQNIAAPLLFDGYRVSQVESKVDELLEQLDIAHRKNHGIDELSGGELQRVAIARSLISEPGLILADEPTGSLDSETGNEIVALLRKLMSERALTIIVMTHDREVTSYADRVITLKDGRVEMDTFTSLKSDHD